MFIELRGQQVHTVSFGSGETTIVGVSGSIGTWEIWEQPFELLSQDHRVIAYDHFGAGETRVPVRLVTFEEHVAVVEALLDAYGVERCVLAADSAMAAVGVEAAFRFADRVEALVLVAGGVAHRADPVVTNFVEGLRSDFEATLELFVTLCVPEDGSEHIRSWLRDIIRRTGSERAAVLLESFYGIDVTHRLPHLMTPTVVVHGEQDGLPTSTLDDARDIASRIPRARLEVLPGAGHVPTLTRPAEIASIIDRLVRTTTRDLSDSRSA